MEDLLEYQISPHHIPALNIVNTENKTKTKYKTLYHFTGIGLQI